MSVFKNIFSRYPAKYFLETGTCYGNSVQLALESKAFEEIYSIELADTYYTQCQLRFNANPNVHLIHGDSSLILWDVIKELNAPITFWLDAHYTGMGHFGDTAHGVTDFPLFNELAAIEKHPCKQHTLLIDDLRCFDSQAIVRRVLELNPAYTITYEDGCVPNDILVARSLK